MNHSTPQNPLDILDDEDFEKLKKLEACQDLSFLKAVEILGLDPKADFRYSDLRDVDLSNVDRSTFDFTGAILEEKSTREGKSTSASRFAWNRTGLSSDAISMAQKLSTGDGVIAELHRRGGAAIKSLVLYGIGEDSYQNDDELHELLVDLDIRFLMEHPTRSPSILASTLDERDIGRELSGRTFAQSLWDHRGTVPIVMASQSLREEVDGVMLPQSGSPSNEVVANYTSQGVYVVGCRAMIVKDHRRGISGLVRRQLEWARQVRSAGCIPYLSLEVVISIEDKDAAESSLAECLLAGLNAQEQTEPILLGFSLPESPRTYDAVTTHSSVIRTIGVAGGYDRAEVSRRHGNNPNWLLSFGRSNFEPSNLSLRSDLTSKEQTFLSLIEQGKSLSEAAKEVGIGRVRAHHIWKSILGKAGSPESFKMGDWNV